MEPQGRGVLALTISGALGGALCFAAPGRSPSLRVPTPASASAGSAANSVLDSSLLAYGSIAGLAAGLSSRKVRRAASRMARRAETEVKMKDCPYTVWGQKDIDLTNVEVNFKPCPLEVPIADQLSGDLSAQERYFAVKRLEILQQLRDHGAVVFRGFDLMKEPEGFQKFYQALRMDPCVDPLHSVSARDMVSQKGGIYEAVNKESRQRFFVGMHNEMVGNRTPGAAAFVCFKPAEEGGEFLILDGRKMVTDLDRGFLDKLYKKEIRYSTAEFPMGFLDSPLLAWAKDFLTPVMETVMRTAVAAKVDFETELVWAKSEYDSSKILQVRSQPQPPILRHPHTGLPVWFFNVHSHSAWLRDERQKIYGDEGLNSTTGASSINRTDCYFADSGETLSHEELRYIDEVTMKGLKYIKMQKGDVVLLDNYSVLHGRAPFFGTRKHAVTWFNQPDYSEIQ